MGGWGGGGVVAGCACWQKRGGDLRLLMHFDDEIVAGKVALSSESAHTAATSRCDRLAPLSIEQVAGHEDTFHASAHLAIVKLPTKTPHRHSSEVYIRWRTTACTACRHRITTLKQPV